MIRIQLIYFFFLLCLFKGNAQSQQTTINSPDGKLKLQVSVIDGKPTYNVLYNGKIFLEQSPLGLKTNVGDFSSGLELKDKIVQNKIDETYELPNIKQSKVHYVANEMALSFTKEKKTAIDVVFRVSNNDVAFRYKVYPQNKALSAVVNEEVSGFLFPTGTTTFLSAQSDAMVGYARTMPSYEIPYTVDAPIGGNGMGNGYTFPCLFKMKDSNGWVLISETGVDSNYCASRLIGGQKGLYTIGFPMVGENNGNGSSAPGIALPSETPWRTITVGETLAPIVQTTVPFDLVKSHYEASQKYEYTKGSWSWILGQDKSMNYDEQIRFVNFSADMGYQTLLVDAFWDTKIGHDKMETFAKYAASKGVSLYLWYNSNGNWNDAPQTPKGIMNNTIARRKEMAWMKKIGIKGIKVDFFGGDKQETMKLYEDILYDANDYGIMVIFHGTTLPRGWERMYPNYVSSEAVLASENLYFNQSNCDTEAFNATLHCFIRNTVGSMDFGGSALNKFYNDKNTPNKGSKRMTSDVYALATAVLFQSGVQHFALAPNNLTDAPKWAIDFMKEVPTTWDEVRFIEGYPGKYAILARRKGSKWYVAGINAQKEVVRTKVKLGMIAAGEKLKKYSDDNVLNGSVTDVIQKKNQEIELIIPCNGAVLITN
ncbi:glycoside hydrolase family 97 catalytic domain-containing protein [Flavobacterium sp. WC2509]|uniref:glycoside hydrolase family 97 catalytic domain-containing protein n=1 Tax=Flavobacterium sp. WC2509 TaxID=3461406 RepID=UPI004044290D